MLKSKLSLVNCPSLIIQGTNDESVSKNSAIKIYHGINSSKKELLFIEGAHHPLMQEKDYKDELFSTTIHFIKQVLGII